MANFSEVDINAQSDIRHLQKGTAISRAAFGRKAANLCRFPHLISRIAPGFVLSKKIVRRISSGSASAHELCVLKYYYKSYFSDGCGAIVRSSSTMEAGDTLSFSGIFKSIGGVFTFDDLLKAITTCYLSSLDDAVLQYCGAHSLKLPDTHLGVIVQRQIDYDVAAILRVGTPISMAELYVGDFPIRINGGGGSPDMIILFNNGVPSQIRQEASVSNVVARGIVEKIGEMVKVWRAAIHRRRPAITLEVAFSGGGTETILQCDPDTRSNEVFECCIMTLISKCSADKIKPVHGLGMKAEAMSYFSENGLFPGGVIICDASKSIESIDQNVSEIKSSPRGYTVRYSKGTEIGLPRSFIANKEDISPWIRRTREAGWSTIIHPHIDVKRSFEVLISIDSILMEHIPGMWESNNAMDPDVVLITQNGAKVWRCRHPREAKYADPGGWSAEYVDPVDASTFTKWVNSLSCIAGVIRRDFHAGLPLNLHFVEDADGGWYFLNMRPGFSIDGMSAPNGRPHVVCDASDMEAWDQSAPILLRFVTERGAERQIISIAQHLPRHQGFVVLVDFGILSHPAMVLRELGFNVLPSYLHPGTKLLSNAYEEVFMDCDQGKDPIERIRTEESVYCSTDIRVVRDREPVCPEHYLAVAEADIPSFADGKDDDAISALLGGQGTSPFIPGEWLFAERGRATFCTSGLTTPHAHAHLIPLGCLRQEALIALRERINAKHYSSLSAALAAARVARGEYILLASNKDGAFLRIFPPSDPPEKRLIRNFIREWQK